MICCQKEMKIRVFYRSFTWLPLIILIDFIRCDVIKITPSGPLTVPSGATLNFNCTVSTPDIAPQTMHWDYGHRNKARIKKINDNTLQLILANIDTSDSGHVACKGENKFGHIQYKSVRLNVLPAAEVSCSPRTQFRCGSGECIFLQFRCDNRINCKDSSDEEGCDKSCSGGFLCNNGRCIDSALVCDRFHTNNCGDWSDEVCRIDGDIGPGPGGPINGGDDRGVRTSQDEDWIPMTVYITVGCVIALAMIVAILVVTAFRIRLKHNLARRYHTPELVSHEQHPSPYVHRLAAYDVDSGLSDDCESVRGQHRPYTDDPNMPQGESPPPPYALVEIPRFTSVRSGSVQREDESLPLGADFASSGLGASLSNDSPGRVRSSQTPMMGQSPMLVRHSPMSRSREASEPPSTVYEVSL